MSFWRNKIVALGAGFLISAFIPQIGFSLSIWLPLNFGEYYDSLDSRDAKYVMVYGHFESVGDTSYEDVTDRNSDRFRETGGLTFRIFAEAVFVKTDPLVGLNSVERVNVTRRTYWYSNPLGLTYGGPPGPESYLDIKYTVPDGTPTDYFYFFEIVNGGLLATNYHYKFGNRLSPAQAEAASRCNFFDECSRRDISRLRSLKLQW